MFDTMTLTKVVGGVCGALLIYLMSKWAAESLYHPAAGHGHGDDHHASGYVIATGDDHGEEEEVEEVDFATLLASADVKKGEKVFGKCKACHKLEDGANSTGPYLTGLIDRPIGTASGFKYSGALNQAGEAWDVDTLNVFLESPKALTPGTTMSFKGLSKPQDRANVIAYLQGF